MLSSSSAPSDSLWSHHGGNGGTTAVPNVWSPPNQMTGAPQSWPSPSWTPPSIVNWNSSPQSVIQYSGGSYNVPCCQKSPLMPSQDYHLSDFHSSSNGNCQTRTSSLGGGSASGHRSSCTCCPSYNPMKRSLADDWLSGATNKPPVSWSPNSVLDTATSYYPTPSPDNSVPVNYLHDDHWPGTAQYW